MTLYTHLTTQEREMIFLYHSFGFSFRRIGRLIKRLPSTVIREIKRHYTKIKPYSPSLAQKSYHKNKQKCGRKHVLDTSPLKKTICKLFLEDQWTPEQIANRIKMEKHTMISYNTIYLPFIVVCLIKDSLKTVVVLVENLDEKEKLDANDYRTVAENSMMLLQYMNVHLKLRTERP